MNGRTVLSLNRLRDVGYVLRIEEEIVGLVAGEEDQTVCDLTALEAPLTEFRAANGVAENVGQVGMALFGVLAHHGPVNRQLVAAAKPDCALLIDDMSPDAQSLPWETLRNDGGFLAFSGAPLLGRTVTARQQQQPMIRVWDQTLRVLAVLAATSPDGEKRTAAAELRALVAGLTAPGGPPFELLVLGCDFDLPGVPPEQDVQAVARELRAGLGATQTIEFRELKDLTTLADAIADQQPHIVHFFCHGIAADDMEPRLELARRTDQIAGKARGSLLLEAPDLHECLARGPGLWLAVLNCCLGAAATESASLARRVIADPGKLLPAIIGMREPIDRRDAHTFTQAFYREAVTLISRTVGGAKQPSDMEWLQALPMVRQAMCKARCGLLSAASACREWTSPVLYVRREVFQIKNGDAVLDLPTQVRIGQLQGQLKAMKSLRGDFATMPSIPPEKLAALDARIAQLTTQLLDLITAN